LKAADRNIEVMQPYLDKAAAAGRSQVAAIGVAQEVQRVLIARQRDTDPGKCPQFSFDKKDRRVTVYYFYLWDASFGPAFIKICTYCPWPMKIWVNGHERAKQQARKVGLQFTELSNGFASCEDPGRQPMMRADGGVAGLSGNCRPGRAAERSLLHERVSSSLLAGAEQGDGLIDATLPGVGALGGGDAVDVIPLHTVGELAEECADLLVGRERGGEGHLPRGVRDGQGDTDGISAVQPGGLADGGADADHVLAAHHADRVPVFVPVDVDQHGRSVPGRELLNGFRRYHDPSVVAGDGNDGLECHAVWLGCPPPLAFRRPELPS